MRHSTKPIARALPSTSQETSTSAVLQLTDPVGKQNFPQIVKSVHLLASSYTAFHLDFWLRHKIIHKWRGEVAAAS